MKVVVTIPWRETPDRLRWLEVVKRHYAAHFPGVLVAAVNSDASKPFNRSQARNNCMAYAVAKGATVVVINDADTLVRSAALREAIADASTDSCLHLPFSTIEVFKGDAAASFAANVSFPESGGYPSTGGIYVCSPAAWAAFGGADEEFEGWGGEDDAIVAMANATCGVRRHMGVGVSLGHAAERLANPNYAKNMMRARVYQNLAGQWLTVEEMMAMRAGMKKRMNELCQARVLVVVPSRGRPDNMVRLIESFRATRAMDTFVVVCVDEDDSERNEYSEKLQKIDNIGDFFGVVGKRQRLNAWWNEIAAKHADNYDYMLFAGDDNVFVTPGWDFLLVDALRQHNNAGFATGPDMLRTDRKFTWAMISTDQLKRVGYVGPSELTHLCIDTAWQYVASETDTMWWVDAAVIEHRHYARSDVHVTKDQTYADANAPEMYRRDHEALHRWHVSLEFQRYCGIVRDMLEGKKSNEPDVEPMLEVSLGGKQIFSGTLKQLLEKLA